MGFMGPLKLSYLLVLLLGVSLIYGAHGRISSSKEDDLELERQLKILNKPPIKTVQGESGDIFDCVDIHKQPAFDNPLLKNHKIQMEPNNFPEEFISDTSSIDKDSRLHLKGIDCPKGAVPIRRTRKEDLRRAKSLATESALESRAIAKMMYSAAFTYYGVQGRINVQNPRVEDDQMSSAQIWVENGPTDQLNDIRAGWTVAPQLFGDAQTRLSIYWSVLDGNNKRGCLNLLCPGFVQVDQKFPIGHILSPYSVYGGPQYAVSLSIYQDNTTKNWWLTSVDQTIKYGYWPSSLFTHLGDGASLVAWGGLTKRSVVTGASPPMGSGIFPDGHYDHACFISYIKVIDESHSLSDPQERLMETHVDTPKCYDMKNYGDVKGAGMVVMFGGPGGSC